MPGKLKQQETGFTIVSNKVVSSKGLSLSAKGLYAYLRSKPEGWQFSSERIVLECKECADTIRAILLELEQAECLIRKRKPDGRMEYLVQHKPLRKISLKEKILKGKSPDISNTELNNNIILNNKYIAEASSAVFSFNNYLEELLNSSNGKLQIIATYWQYRKKEFDTKEKCSAAIQRDIRSAKDLLPWSLDEIKKVMYWLNGTKIDWGLSTVLKYIDKDLEKIRREGGEFYGG